MKDNKIKDKVLGFLKENPNSTMDQLMKSLKLSHIITNGALKQLQNDKLVEAHPDDGTYCVVSKKKETPVAEVKTQPAKAEKKATEKDADLGDPTPSGRNNDKFILEGTKDPLPKGRFVLLVIRKHCEAKKLSLAKLQELFNPDNTIQPRFGTVSEISVAKSFSKNGKDRFLLAEDCIFRTSDNKKVCCCSQWTASNMKPLLAIFKQLGYKWKVA
ncbi:MAG: MarR family transcriptional regulator [Bacteroidia bacterium]